MYAVIQALIARVKAFIAASAALDLEADLLMHVAERKAHLLRQADRYTVEGLHNIADQLRHQAGELSVQQPLAGVLPMLAHLEEQPQATPLLRLVPEPDEDQAKTDMLRPVLSLPTTKPNRRRKS